DRSTRGGVLDATAGRDINIQELHGDLLAGQIRSTSGSVTLNAPEGRILDASRQTSGQALDATQLGSIRKMLHLTAADNLASVSTQGILAFERGVVSHYQQYWYLIGHGTVVGDTYQLDASGLHLFRAQTAASLGVSVVTADQENTFANAQYRKLVNFFNKNL